MSYFITYNFIFEQGKGRGQSNKRRRKQNRREVKQWVGTTVEHDEITDSRRVQCFISTREKTIDNPDSSNWELTNDSTTGFGGTEFQINRNARYLNLKVVLSANQDFTATPTFRSVSARALPRPQLIVVDIPVNISDQVERPNRKRILARRILG